MKKIFCIIILVVSVFTANAQKVYTEVIDYRFDKRPASELQIGEYKGREAGRYDMKNGGVSFVKDGKTYHVCDQYFFELNNHEEAENLIEFINTNKEKLGEKLGLIFIKDAKWFIERENSLLVYAITPEEKALIEKHEVRVAEAKEMAKVERENRMNNLLKIIE